MVLFCAEGRSIGKMNESILPAFYDKERSVFVVFLQSENKSPLKKLAFSR